MSDIDKNEFLDLQVPQGYNASVVTVDNHIEVTKRDLISDKYNNVHMFRCPLPTIFRPNSDIPLKWVIMKHEGTQILLKLNQ